MMFKALVGPGTNETEVRRIIDKRSGDLATLYDEFGDLISALVAERNNLGKTAADIGTTALKGSGIGAIMGAITLPATRAAIAAGPESAAVKKSSKDALKQHTMKNMAIGGALFGGAVGLGMSASRAIHKAIMTKIQNEDLVDYLINDGMKSEARMVQSALAMRDGVPSPVVEGLAKRLIKKLRLREMSMDRETVDMEDGMIVDKDELATQIRHASKDIYGTKDHYDLRGKSVEELEDILYDLANSQEQRYLDDEARIEMEDEMGYDSELSRAEMAPSRQGMSRRPRGAKSIRRMGR